MLHAAPLRIGNREEHTRVVAFFQYASGGSHRQDRGILWGVPASSLCRAGRLLGWKTKIA